MRWENVGEGEGLLPPRCYSVLVEIILGPDFAIDHDKGATIFLCQTIHQVGGIILIVQSLILKRGGRATD